MSETPHDTLIRPGVGIYSRAEAARLLQLSPSRLGRWVRGYTYWLLGASERRALRHKPPVIRSDLPMLHRTVALSFLELMELRVVKALVDAGVSLQHVRSAARLAAEHFNTAHPFASQRVFTDGQGIFSAVTEERTAPHVVRWAHGDIEQIIAGGLSIPFLNEIEFDHTTTLAQRWWPQGRSTPIVLDPRIAFGAPVIAGTGVRAAVVAQLAQYTSPEEAARAYGVEVDQVAAAVGFEYALAA